MEYACTQVHARIAQTRQQKYNKQGHRSFGDNENNKKKPKTDESVTNCNQLKLPASDSKRLIGAGEMQGEKQDTIT